MNKILTDGYDQLFDKMKSDGYFGTVSFRLINGEVTLIKFESTFKTVQDALTGKTTSAS